MTQATRGKRKRSWLDRLPADFFGSDVFIAYQGTYVWQANQMGHFAIGFALMSLIGWIVLAFCEAPGPALPVAAFLLILVYAGKEFLDLLIARRQARGFFAYEPKELWWDMAADTWFVASGVLTAMAAFAHPVAGIVMLGISAVAFLAIRPHFVPSKASLDRTALPFIFRLANFPHAKGVHPHNARRIRAFIADRPVEGFAPSPALLIQGYRSSGKTTLAVGVGAEAALGKRHGEKRYTQAVYFTAFGLFERDAPAAGEQVTTLRRRKPRLLGTGDPWSLEEAEYVIIDDVDSDNPVYGGSTPKEILDNIEARPELAQLLRAKRTVWVTGNSRFEDPVDEKGWVAWLAALCDFYGCTMDETASGDSPADIVRREPIPVIWLRHRLEVLDA